MLIRFENIAKTFAQRMIFSQVNLSIEQGDRIGLVGANGAGKTTLLGVLTGELIPDEGECFVQKDLRIGFLKQNSGVESENTIADEMNRVFEELLAVRRQLEVLSEQIAQEGGTPELTQEYARLTTYFEANEGYQIDVKIKTILNGMGFLEKDMQTVCKTLSGGEKTRLALAKILLSEPDLLILDEPTNHLDFKALFWLEEYLQKFKGTLLVVSHDRYFLDKLCMKIWEVANLRVESYRGNYTKYLATREMLYERQQKEYEQQQAQVVKLTDYIARNKARASTAAMARSRERMLEKVEVVKRPPPPLYPVRMAFRYEQEPAKEVLTVTNLSLQAGDKPLCSGAEFSLRRGDKVALIGANGVGKSTFLKTVAGRLEPKAGKIVWGKGTKVSYFEQEQLELTPYKTALSEVWDRFPSTYEQDVRNALACMLFTGESVYKRVDMLSGGERARLKFVIMMYEAGNVLLLDEPTNHLDLATREVLEKALQAYSGTVLAVSHDRYLLSRVPDRIVEMTPTGFTWYEGKYEAYLQNKQTGGAGETRQDADPRENEKQENTYYRGKKQRAQDAAKKKRLAELEQEISDLELLIAQQQELLESPEVTKDYLKLEEVLKTLGGYRETLSQSFDEWAELAE